MPGDPPLQCGKDESDCRGQVARCNNNKNNNNYRVRPVSVAKPDVYDISLASVVEAYEDCIRHKKGSDSYTAFTFHYETALVELWEAIKQGRYQPSTSKAFVVRYPTPREIFAAAFIDRVVHHWIGIRITPMLEAYFAEAGNVTMNCRRGMGTKAAIDKVAYNIWRFSEGYTRGDCWILKGDIANFFMSIDKGLLMEMVAQLIEERYAGEDKRTLLYLLSVTIAHCPQDNCERCSADEAWDAVPKRKSLFGCDPRKGMPIGNLPSQLLANLYAAVFVHWVVKVKGVKTMVIYADDFVLLTRSKEEALALVAEMKQFLGEQLLLRLHPRKIYIQHYKHGVKFVGAMILPGRVYMSRRTIGRFWETSVRYAKRYRSERQKLGVLECFVASVNSYLGMMSHHRSFKQRRRICEALILPHWWRYLYFEDEYRVCRIRRRYDRRWRGGMREID